MGDGYRLTDAAGGVDFDLNVDGARRRLAWTAPDSGDAFLVLDRNGNGLIDNGSELFGNFTPKRDGSLAVNGFDALLDVDGGPAVSDGKINASDPIYARLRLWTDRNHNGFSEPSELSTLLEGGVTTLYTAYRENGRRDQYGNRFVYMGTTLVIRRGVEFPRHIVDVFFVAAR